LSVAGAPERPRLFLALWPPPVVTRRLAQVTAALHAQCGGRSVSSENQHITAVFLGAVAATRMSDIECVMRAAACERFELTLDRLQYRKRGGMLWARAAQTPQALDALVRRLRAALAALGFAIEARAFVAHVTLLRDAKKPAAMPQFAPMHWPVDALALVRSTPGHGGARYETVFRVPLAG